MLKSGAPIQTGKVASKAKTSVAEVSRVNPAVEKILLKSLIGKGQWTGSVTQQSSSTPYSIKLKYGNGFIEVDYPELACGGVWEFASKVKENTWLLTERLTYGADRCVDGGEVLLALLRHGVVRYEWASASGKDAEGWAELTYGDAP